MTLANLNLRCRPNCGSLYVTLDDISQFYIYFLYDFNRATIVEVPQQTCANTTWYKFLSTFQFINVISRLWCVESFDFISTSNSSHCVWLNVRHEPHVV